MCELLIYMCTHSEIDDDDEMDGAMQPDQQSEEPTDWDYEDVKNDGVLVFDEDIHTDEET